MLCFTIICFLFSLNINLDLWSRWVKSWAPVPGRLGALNRGAYFSWHDTLSPPTLNFLAAFKDAMAHTFYILCLKWCQGESRAQSLDYGAEEEEEEARNASAVAGAQPRSRSSSAAVAASHLWGRGRPGAMAGSDAVFLGNPAKTLQILTARRVILGRLPCACTLLSK